MEAAPEDLKGLLKEVMSKVPLPKADVAKLPTREIVAILAATAMCIGKHPIQVRDEIPEIRTAALELADALAD